MLVPGGNLLAQALQLLNPTTIRYFQATGNGTSDSGRMTPTFAKGRDIDGCSVQPVPRSKYADYGFMHNKNYVTLWVPYGVIDIQRNTSGDNFVWGGHRYQIESNMDWFQQDGWLSTTAMDIGPASKYPEVPDNA